jgi:hypothetical protein
MEVPTHVETAEAARRLEPIRQSLFACSLAERHLPLLAGQAEDRGLDEASLAARRWLDECWRAALDEPEVGLQRPEELGVLWPWWEGPAAFAAKRALDVLRGASRSLETRSLVGLEILASSESVVLTIAEAGRERRSADLDPVVVRERQDRTADLDLLAQGDDITVVAEQLRSGSAARGQSLLDVSRQSGLREATRPRPQYVPAADQELAPGALEALTGAAEVPWSSAEHAYGAARGVDVLLRNRAARGPELARAAAQELWSSICHQGDVYEATALALPFVLRLATVREVHDRPELVYLAAAAAGSQLEGEALDRVHRVLRGSAVPLVRLLEDDDSTTAICSAAVVAGLPDPPTSALDALQRLRNRALDRDRSAAVALASRIAGLDADPADVDRAINATEAWLGDDLSQLRDALRTASIGARARSDAVEGIFHLTGW